MARKFLFLACSVGGRVYELEAGDRADMLFWLQTLQKKRKEYSVRKTQLSKERFGNVPGSQVSFQVIF